MSDQDPAVLHTSEAACWHTGEARVLCAAARERGTVRLHLHQDDHPEALAILDAVIGDRRPSGYERTDRGAWVNWDELDRSFLSTTERATLHVARGVAILEGHGGGLPKRVALVVVDALSGVGR